MNALKWDKEFALEQAADDAELLEELLEIFKESFLTDLQLIEQGLAEGSTAKMMGAAHSIKGAAASLGILGIKELAMQVEEDSQSEEMDVVREKYEVLHSLLTELKAL